VTRVIVYHSLYGCDTGCCGHIVELDPDGLGKTRFHFDHPYHETPEELKQWIKDLVTESFGEEHVADIDWDNCMIVND
jgi:hypothetical protein